MVGWALLADTVALYPLYALLFTDAGLSEAAISGLLAIWSVVGLVVEVPSGALADRFSRRAALVASGVLQAAAFATWISWPEFAGFALGFVLWGLGGSLASGAQEALLFDGLAAAGAQDHYPRVQARVSAAELVAQLPAAGLATVLFGLGGYDLVGWVSVGTSLAAALVAAGLPEPPRTGGGDGPERDGSPEDEEPDRGLLDTLRAGLAEAVAQTAVRRIVLAAALLGAVDAIEEYDALLAAAWGFGTAQVPAALLVVTAAGAAGALLGGRIAGSSAATPAALFAVGVLALAASAVLARPAGIVLLAVFYGLYRAALLVVDARLQDRIDGPARATVTSVAGFGTDVGAIALYGAWALGGLPLTVGLLAGLAVVLPALLRSRRPVQLSEDR